MIDGYFSDIAPSMQPAPKAIVVPHAGYIYSGSIAASAYARLVPARERIKRVVLLGPSHRVAFNGLAVSSADFFRTPLGKIPLDKKAIESITRLPQVQILDEAHRMEHSLEVHLPFLQSILVEFSLIPIVVGDADSSQVAQVLEQLWGGEETLIVISSDLSHYHGYEIAQKMDRKTSNAIEALNPAGIGVDQACGRNPLNGLLVAAAHHGLRAMTLDLRNSGDTAGTRDRVVGYGAYVFD
jgi:AmmeMemoRadiSam system protein B